MRNEKGFTLVEILVVFVILFVTSTAGIASFRRYDYAKRLDASVAEVESLLNNAKINAVTQTVPSVCNQTNPQVSKYSVRINAPDTYTLNVYCNPGTFSIKTKRLHSDVTFAAAPDNEIIFFAGSGSSQGSHTITFTGMYGIKSIVVDPAGNITGL